MLYWHITLTHCPLGDLDDILKRQFSIWFYCLESWDLHMIMPWWMPQDLIDDKSTFISIITRCHQAPIHYLNQCWPRSLWPYIWCQLAIMGWHMTLHLVLALYMQNKVRYGLHWAHALHKPHITYLHVCRSSKESCMMFMLCCLFVVWFYPYSSGLLNK